MKPRSPNDHKFLWWRVRPITARRLANFRAHKRGYWSLWLFLFLFTFTLFAELIANDRPLLVWYDGGLYAPVLRDYSEQTFGGDLPTPAEYDKTLQEQIGKKGWMIWPLIPYSYKSPVKNLPKPAPTPPSWQNWLGTDYQARDVLARVIYGFRISVLFGLVLTILSSIVGVAAGAVQGYFGGRVDLYFQRFMEIWDSVPVLYLLIILSAFIQPDFWWLLGIMLLFSWMGLVGVVRAEFLRARNFDYVRAARAMGASSPAIMFRHILPNALVATISFMPFITSGSIGALTALDYLGFGLPPGSASLGELAKQGKEFATIAPWLGITAFVIVAIMLSLLVFIGEAVRDAFDPRKSAISSAPAAEPQPALPTAAAAPASGAIT
ncbi:MAG TPA: ABC transporter permease [Alphaproteobacteria bacterium]|jgi:microcin C transport system permease protein